MPIIPSDSQLSLKDLIDRMDTGEIRVNLKYQRSGQIWPARAKSFLVETVLTGMPIPRVLLHVVPNPTAPHVYDIIDGQQRSNILSRFRKDKFSLNSAPDDENLHGKKFSQLSAAQRSRFDAYPVPLDLYQNVNSRQIREVFRRLNYYTAPLNAAEQRHAQFFGELSRFVEDQTLNWKPTFDSLGLFTKKQYARKADQQLMAEIVNAMLNGISTPTAKSLRDFYKLHERQFSSAPDFGRKLRAARENLDRWGALTGTALVKHYQVFALVVALIHATGDLASVRDDLGPSTSLRSDDDILRGFEALDGAIARKVTRGRYAKFWAASHEKTNVRENRLQRCKYFYSALTGN